MLSGFDDLLDPLFSPPANESAEPHVIGSTLNITVTVRDGFGQLINLSSGYSAMMTPHTRSGLALPAFTQTITSGRQVDFSVVGQVSVRATPVASTAMYAPYAGQVLRGLTLLVTRTLDGATAVIFRDCYLPLAPNNNP